MIGFVEDAHCFQAVSLIIGCGLAASAKGNDYYREEAQLTYIHRIVKTKLRSTQALQHEQLIDSI